MRANHRWIFLAISLVATPLAGASPSEIFRDEAVSRPIEERIDNSATWSHSTVSTVSPSSDFAEKIPLTLIVTTRSMWDDATILTELRKAETVFSQCQVSFSPITLVQASVESTKPYDYDGSDADFFDDGLFARKPILVVDAQRLIAGKQNSGGYANPAYWSHGDSVNTAFVFDRGYQLEKAHPSPHAGYSMMAHELAHVLFNEPHNSDDGNILCGTPECKGPHITPQQCQSIDEEFFLN